MQFIQPYISDIVQALVGILVTVLLAAMATVKQKAEAWIQSHTTANQRVMLHQLADEGFAYAQTVFKEYGGQDKLQQAMTYVNRSLLQRGIHVDEVEIRAVVEKAYLAYKAKTTITAPALGETEVPAPPPEPQTVEVIPPAAQQLIDAALAFAQNQAVPDPVPQQPELPAPVSTEPNALVNPASNQ